MPISDDDLRLAAKIAASTSSRWGAVDFEDVQSVLIVWLFENERVVDRYRSEDDGLTKLTVALRRTAAKWAADEQRHANGGSLDFADDYTVDQIERAMPYVFESVPQHSVVDGVSNSFHEFGMALAVLTDIRQALDRIGAEHREALILRFRDGLTYLEIGGLVGITKDGARKRVHGALTALKIVLNAIE